MIVKAQRIKRLFLVAALGMLGCGDNDVGTQPRPDAQTEPANPDAGTQPTTPDAGTQGVTDLLQERSTSVELFAKRYIAAGDRAYVIGAGDGLFPPMGWHIRGEMGGVWTHPIKLLDGYWFAIDGSWLTDAQTLTTGIAHAAITYPTADDLTVTRREFVPDGEPVVLIELTLRNEGSADRDVALTMDMHSELMASYPWGWTTPNARDANGADTGAYDEKTGVLTFSEPNKPWTAVIKSSVTPASGSVGPDFWGPVPAAEQAGYSEYGNGTGGQLTWNVGIGAGEETVIWLAVAGSHIDAAAAMTAATEALADPEAKLEARRERRKELLAQTNVVLPDALIQEAFHWSKLNMDDLRITVENVQIRDVSEGRVYPEPIVMLAEITGIGAGFPDYPWLFGTDGAYTSFPLVVAGQWDTAMQHLRAIRDISVALNGDTGKVVHEVMTEGSVYFGNNEAPGNTNETAQFAIAVDLLWRWSGDNAFRDEMLDFVKKGLTFVTTELDADGDGWPEGYGMVERGGMGGEKLDVTAYTWQAMIALERMATAAGDTEAATFARERAMAMEAAFEATWWNDEEDRYADSLCNLDDLDVTPGQDWVNYCQEADTQLQQRHWINAVPMEVAMADAEHAAEALGELEAHSGPCGIYHTGHQGGPNAAGELKCWTLPTSVMAVAEANYGRLRDNQALFYIRAIAELLTLETPGALPEISSSPEYNPFADFRERAMFMQAWSPYGILWPVVHHFLGVDPNVPAGRLAVIPDIPESWPGLSVTNLRVGEGTISVEAHREDGTEFHTRVEAPAGWTLVIGQVLPVGSEVESVTLDGEEVAEADLEVVDTLRGREVRVTTTTSGVHDVMIEAR